MSEPNGPFGETNPIRVDCVKRLASQQTMGCKRSRPIVSGLLFTIEKPTRTCGRQSILPPALRVSGAERPLERHPPRTFARSNRPETPHRPAAPDPHFPEHMMSPVSRRFVLTGAALTT